MIRPLLTLFTILFFSACEKNFIAEPVDPRLPAYTEEGENIGGAYINDQPWIVENIPATFYSNTISGMRLQYALDPEASSEKTRITFRHGIILNENRYTEIKFYFKNYRLSNRTELKAVEGTKINLDNQSAWAELILGEQQDQDTLLSTNGAFYIRNVEYVPDREHTIVSGTFGFEVESGDSLISISSGRYDFDIDNLEFYVF